MSLGILALAAMAAKKTSPTGKGLLGTMARDSASVAWSATKATGRAAGRAGLSAATMASTIAYRAATSRGSTLGAKAAYKAGRIGYGVADEGFQMLSGGATLGQTAVVGAAGLGIYSMFRNPVQDAQSVGRFVDETQAQIRQEQMQARMANRVSPGILSYQESCQGLTFGLHNSRRRGR